jgi:hypothetical protein
VRRALVRGACRQHVRALANGNGIVADRRHNGFSNILLEVAFPRFGRYTATSRSCSQLAIPSSRSSPSARNEWASKGGTLGLLRIVSKPRWANRPSHDAPPDHNNEHEHKGSVI